jgi:hypothetical protein
MAVGGWSELTVRYLQAVPNETYPNTSCGVPRQDSWIMLRDPIHSDMPWPAFLLGQTPSSIWYWCADQVRTTFCMKRLDYNMKDVFNLDKFNRGKSLGEKQEDVYIYYII